MTIIDLEVKGHGDLG